MGINGPAITIEPTTPNVKFGGEIVFTSSLPGKFQVSSQIGSTIEKLTDTTAKYTAGFPATPQQTSANDFVEVTDVSQPTNKAATEVAVSK